MDVQVMTSQAIEGLSKKEEQIKALQKKIEALTSQLMSRVPQRGDEKEFKARVAPPPPPPIAVKVKRDKSSVPSQTSGEPSNLASQLNAAHTLTNGILTPNVSNPFIP
jgi:hypothetical protein